MSNRMRSNTRNMDQPQFLEDESALRRGATVRAQNEHAISENQYIHESLVDPQENDQTMIHLKLE